MRKILALLKEARPEIIGGLVVAAILSGLATLSAIITDIGLWSFGLTGVALVWGGCLYVGLSRVQLPLLRHEKRWKYPRWRRPALVAALMLPLLAGAGGTYYAMQQAEPLEQVLILVADFDGPEPQTHRVTEAILSRLHNDMRKYDDVRIEALGRPITENRPDSETGKVGQDAAHTIGLNRKATVVIWGWYGVEAQAVPVSVHFELIRVPIELQAAVCPASQGEVRTAEPGDLESFVLQSQLGDELSYLSLVATGIIRFAMADFEGAIARFDDAFARFDDDLSESSERPRLLDPSLVLLYRGSAHLIMERYKEARTDLNHCLDINPDVAIGYYFRAEAATNLGDTAAAIRDYDKTIELMPGYACAYYLRGGALKQQGRHTEAMTSYQQAITYFTNPVEIADTYVMIGGLYLDESDTEAASAAYTKAIELAGVAGKNVQARAYHGLALVKKASGQFAGVIDDYSRAISLDPKYAEGYFSRGNEYDALGRFEEAIRDYSEAIRLKPGYVDAIYGRGNTKYHQGDRAGALVDLNKALDLDSSYAVAYFTRGAVYKDQGQTGLAVPDFERFLSLSTDSYWRAEAQRHLDELQNGQ